MKVLITSFGSIAKRHLRNVKELLPKAEVGVLKLHRMHSGPFPDGVDHFFSSLEEALKFNPDIAIIASPASEHVNLAVLLLEQGVPTFIEKPLALSEDDSKPLERISNPPFVMVGYVLRFQPILHDIKNIIASGRLGRNLISRIQVGQYLPDWRPDSDYREGVSARGELGGGALLELSHEIDYATWLLGWPDSLFCSSSKISDLEIDVEDHALLIFELSQPEKRKVSLQLDFLQRVPQMTVQIVGSEGTLKADLIKETVRIFDSDHTEGEDCRVRRMANGNEMYLRQFDLFFYKSVDGYHPRFESTREFTDWATLSSSSKVVRIVDKAKESSRTGGRQFVN